MENNEALNCPCCDGKPKYCISGNINPPSHWYYIMCYDCGLESGKFKTNQEAIKAWNTRACTNNELVRALLSDCYHYVNADVTETNSLVNQSELRDRLEQALSNAGINEKEQTND